MSTVTSTTTATGRTVSVISIEAGVWSFMSQAPLTRTSYNRNPMFARTFRGDAAEASGRRLYDNAIANDARRASR